MNAIILLARRYAAGAWRRRWYSLALTWLICLGGWAYVSTIPNRYQSNARIHIDVDAVLTSLLRGVSLDSSADAMLDLLQRTLLSRPNIEKVIAKIEPLDVQARTAASREAMLARLASEIHVQPQTKNLFSVSYESTNRALCTDVVKTVLTLFMESATGNNRSDMDNAKTFLDKQILGYESKLRDAEQRRAEFQGKYMDLLPGTNGGASRLETSREAIIGINGSLTDAKWRRQILQNQLDKTQPMLTTEQDMINAFGPGGGLSEANNPLAAAKKELADLLLRDTEKHPDVVAARKKIEQLTQQEAKDGSGAPKALTRSRSISNPVYEQISSKILDSDANIASLQRQISEANELNARIMKIAQGAPGVEAQFENLDRDYNVVKRNYDDLISRRESMRITASANAEADKLKLDVVDPPSIPQTPVGPNRKALVSMVLVFGLGAGTALAFGLAWLDRSFYTVQDVEAFGLNVIGALSFTAPERQFSYLPRSSTIAFCVGLAVLIAAYSGLAMTTFWISSVA